MCLSGRGVNAYSYTQCNLNLFFHVLAARYASSLRYIEHIRQSRAPLMHECAPLGLCVWYSLLCTTVIDQTTAICRQHNCARERCAIQGFSFRGFKDRSGERWEMPLQEDVLDNPRERTEALSPTTNVAYCYANRPVQAKRATLCPPLMPHAIATRMSHIWHHTDRYNISYRMKWPIVSLLT